MCGIDVTVASGDAAAATLRSAAAAAAEQHQLLRRRGPDTTSEHTILGTGFAVRLVGSVLSLRGEQVVAQPLLDAKGNALLWNGEIFGGQPSVPTGSSDTQCLLAALTAAPAWSIPDVMRQVQGPWAFAFWHAESRTLWYGRDPLGRRSLLRAGHREGEHAADGGLLLRLSSVAPLADSPPSDGAVGTWDELPADGMGSAHVLPDGRLEMRWHAVPPMPPPLPLDSARLNLEGGLSPGSEWEAEATRHGQAAAARFLGSLSEAVRVRVCGVPDRPVATVATVATDRSQPQTAADRSPMLEAPPAGIGISAARVAVLFSGGIDCMMLARLADLHLPPNQPLDLINVAFGQLAACAPDRLTGRLGAAELRSLSHRTFNLIEVDVTLEELQRARTHLLGVLHPSNTVMDLNIGASFWFGARGQGVLLANDEALQADALGEKDGPAACRYAGGGGGTVDALADARPSVPSARQRLRVRVSLRGCGGVELRLSLLGEQGGAAEDGGDGGEQGTGREARPGREMYL